MCGGPVAKRRIGMGSHTTTSSSSYPRRSPSLATIACLCLLLLLQVTLVDGITEEGKGNQICSLSGGLNAIGIMSSILRVAFQGALQDVEFIREFLQESARNHNEIYHLQQESQQQEEEGQLLRPQSMIRGISLEELAQTLDREARNFTSNTTTTVEAGLGYTDDRPDRRVERYVGLIHEPFVGTKQTDLSFIEPTATIFPSLVDRTSNVAYDPSGSRNTGQPLYQAAWIGTRGEAWMYYPPLTQSYGHPLTFGDVLGPRYDSQDEEFVKPNLPPAFIDKAYFTQPYPDTAIPGLSLITAQAPIYYAGDFMGYTYPNNTYIASAGVDISVSSMSTLLHVLEGTVTAGSFAIVVGATDLHTILMSQSTVEKLYPRRTGMEESRIIRDAKDGSIVKDGRNQPYQVSDTIYQPVLNLTNADWPSVAENIRAQKPGERGYMVLNITLTGDKTPTSFYAMYERWPQVADWASILFVPQRELDNSIRVKLYADHSNDDVLLEPHDHAHTFVKDGELHLEVNNGEAVECHTVLYNSGSLDVTARMEKLPPWFTPVADPDHPDKDPYELTYSIPAGKRRVFRWMVSTEGIENTATSLIAFTIKDDGYGDCFFEEVLTKNVLINILYPHNRNQLDGIRPYGFVLSAITVLSAVGWSIWVFLNASHRVVRASQPIFLHMMCAGIGVMGLSIIPLSIDDSLASDDGCDIACMAFPWLLATGFSVAFSALFSKIWRINQIVAACKNYKRVEVSTQHVIMPFCVIFSLNVTILSVWTAVDPLTWVREHTGVDQGSEETHSHGYCSLQGNLFSQICVALLLLVNFAALVLALIQLYRARELDTAYSEGKYIAIAVASMIQVFLTGLPILVIITDNPQASYFIKVSVVFVVAMSLLLLTFVPKFYMAGDEPKTKSVSAEPQVPNSRSAGDSACSGKREPFAHYNALNTRTTHKMSPIVGEDLSQQGQRQQRPPPSLGEDPLEQSRRRAHQRRMHSLPNFQPGLISEMTMSEYDAPDAPSERFLEPSSHHAIAPPNKPTRLPTLVMDDNSSSMHCSNPRLSTRRQTPTLEDIQERRSSASSTPRKPLRFPSEVLDMESTSDFNDEPDSVIQQPPKVDEEKVPSPTPSACREGQNNSPFRNAEIPTRLPSTADEFEV